MWSETVGVRTRPVSDQKIGLRLGLAVLVLCCETRSGLTLVITMILNDTVTFQVLFTYCAWNITTVEINSLVKSKIRQVPLFTSGGLGLVILVLVLLLRIVYITESDTCMCALRASTSLRRQVSAPKRSSHFTPSPVSLRRRRRPPTRLDRPARRTCTPTRAKPATSPFPTTPSEP